MTVETTAPQAQKTMMVPLPNKSPGEPITVRSMTGYARVSGHVAETEFVVDISSLNHRHADVNVTLPAALQGLDVLLRKQVRERVLRGRVRLGISIKRPLNCSRRLQLNLDRAEQYLSYHQTLRDTFGLEGSLDATTLLNAPLVVDVIEDELADEPVTDALRSAVMSFAFPRPPRPPLATTSLCPSSTRSPINRP